MFISEAPPSSCACVKAPCNCHAAESEAAAAPSLIERVKPYVAPTIAGFLLYAALAAVYTTSRM